MRYAYQIDGAAADGQTWHVKGEIDGTRGEFMQLPHKAMGEAFGALVEGRAVYGQPGKGCDGPYSVTRMLIEEALQ